MTSKYGKGKEVETTNKGLKRLRKGTKGLSSSTTKATPARKSGAKVVEPHRLKWFNTQKEPNMLQRIGLTKVTLYLSSPPSATLSASWDWDMYLPSLRRVQPHF
ncbi:hypothetical protein HAX54_025889, partial [Datura stramonium]|nr:hypothetical protein [Datura stramonium]